MFQTSIWKFYRFKSLGHPSGITLASLDGKLISAAFWVREWNSFTATLYRCRALTMPKSFGDTSTDSISLIRSTKITEQAKKGSSWLIQSRESLDSRGIPLLNSHHSGNIFIPASHSLAETIRKPKKAKMINVKLSEINLIRMYRLMMKWAHHICGAVKALSQGWRPDSGMFARERFGAAAQPDDMFGHC